MPINIKNKRSAVKDKAPDSGVLAPGEIAVNYNPESPALYIEDSDGDVVKIAGEAVDLGVGNITGTTLDVTNTGGTDATLPEATTTTAGVMSAADKTKLDANPATPYWDRTGTTLSPANAGDNLDDVGNISAAGSLSVNGGSFETVSNSALSRLFIDSGTANAEADIFFKNNGTNSGVLGYNSTADALGINSFTSPLLQFQSSSSYRAQVETDGTFKIGGSSVDPNIELDATAGSITAAGDLDIGGIIADGNVIVNQIPYGGAGNGLILSKNGEVAVSTQSGATLFRGYQTGVSTPTFSLSAEGNSYFEGSMGIGNLEATPNITLNANGSITAAGNVQVGAFDGSNWTKDGSLIFASGQFRVNRQTGDARVFSAFLGAEADQTIDIRASGSAEFKGDVAIGDSSVTFTTKQQLIAALAPELRQVFAESIEAWLERPEPYEADDPETLPADQLLREAIIRATTVGKINLNSDGAADFTGTVELITDTKAVFGYRGVSSETNLAFRNRYKGIDRAMLTADGNFLIGGTLPSAPNIELNSNGSATFADAITADGNITLGGWQDNAENQTLINPGSVFYKGANNSGAFFSYLAGGYEANDAVLTLHRNGSITAAGESLHKVVPFAPNQNEPYLIAATDAYDGTTTTNAGTYGYQHRYKIDGGGVDRITIDTYAGEVYSMTATGSITAAGTLELGGQWSNDESPQVRGQIGANASNVFVKGKSTAGENTSAFAAFKGGSTGDDRVFNVAYDGSITAAGTIQSVGNPVNGLNAGVLLQETGITTCVASDNNQAIRVYKIETNAEGDVISSTPKVKIFGNGNITATGQLQISNPEDTGVWIQRPGTNTNIGLEFGSGGNAVRTGLGNSNDFCVGPINTDLKDAPIKLNSDGSITAAGRIRTPKITQESFPGEIRFDTTGTYTNNVVCYNGSSTESDGFIFTNNLDGTEKEHARISNDGKITATTFDLESLDPLPVAP